MSDNVSITAGSGTTIAADDVGAGVLVQRVKATWGPDGTANDTDVASGKPMPVQIRSATGIAEDVGVGTGGSNTKRVTIDTAQVPAVGQTTASASVPVTLPSDASASVAATFTPAASSHTAGDCNGAAANWASMGLSGSRIMITGASLEIDGGTAEATAWRVYLYNVTPPSATADDAAWDLPSGDRASFLGYIDLGTAVDLGSTQWVEVQNVNKQIKLSGTGIFGYLVNLTTVSTAAVAHIVTLHAVQL